MPKPSKKESKKTTKEESVHSEPEEVEKDWDQQSEPTDQDARPPRRESIAKFDYEVTRELDKKSLSGVSIQDILKVLVVRGVDSMNPALKHGAKDLLKKLNGERVGPPRNSQFGTNNGGRGGGRGRFSYDREQEPRGFAPFGRH